MTRIIRFLLRVLPILATSSPIVNAEEFAELIPVPDDPNDPGPPAVLFNEAELVSVQDHLDKKSTPPPPPDPHHPNGRCNTNSLYVVSDDDEICMRQHPTEDASFFAARKSVCSPFNTRRIITCQLCYRVLPYINHWNIHAEKKWYVECPRGQRCRHDRRWNRWGYQTPYSTCVPQNTLMEKLIGKGSEIRSYCSKRVRLIMPKNRNKKGPGGQVIAQSAKIHAWLSDKEGGDYIKARWLYLVVNHRLIASVRDTDDWTQTFSVTSIDDVQMCAVPQDTRHDLQLDFQVTVL